MAPQAPIPPLDYRPPGHPPNPGPRRHFFLGLAAGSVASLVFWPAIWHSGGGGPIALAFIVSFILAKLIATIAFLTSTDRRQIGAGLLVSFVIGFMIFFGTCAANFTI